MPKSAKQYGNESISALKGADRVRKRPGVIFGSDGLEGCEHAVFEILSNAIDEAREGHGSLITVTRYEDHSIEVEDFGRGCPVDWNEKEQKYNWELVFCELYAGGKYNTNDGDNYEYSLGLNGLGSCATQYASEYFDAVIHRDGLEYTLHFEKGENIGGLQKAPHSGKKTGSKFRWKPDLEVFTDIDIPVDYYRDVLKWSTPESPSGSAIRPAASSRPPNSGMKTALWTTSPSWRGKILSPPRCSGRPSGRAGTGRTSRNIR